MVSLSANSLEERTDVGAIQSLAPQNPGASAHRVKGIYFSPFDSAPYRERGDAEVGGGFPELQPALVLLLGPVVNRYRVIRASILHAGACPEVALARLQPAAVERLRDAVVGADAGQDADRIYAVFGSRFEVLPTAAAENSKLRVDSALPVDHEVDLGALWAEIGSQSVARAATPEAGSLREAVFLPGLRSTARQPPGAAAALERLRLRPARSDRVAV